MDEASRKTGYSIQLFGMHYTIITPRKDIRAHV